MVMSWIFTCISIISVICAILSGSGNELSSAVLKGAQSGVTLGLTMAGSVCLWSGVGNLMKHNGFLSALRHLLRPILGKLFPSTRSDPLLSSHLTANVCANILGLGNAATPMGIQAAKCLRKNDTASDELCRLVVLNTASIQLIPSTVASLRSGLGSSSPFDILPAVWITSICSAGMGLVAAWCFGKLWQDD